ncbi:MAG: glycosyltransferase [Tannerellaceae bacterium]|jgi:glycosyltransferase involved in cell wall biosynthesis|nr:glycosyltransferase [Tannerellaceae bacterium]
MITFSVIVPVFNRPAEVDELLTSLAEQSFTDFEVILVEDGSTIPCEHVARRFEHRLNLQYLSKPNSGPSPSRNFGIDHARGHYFVFFDSDCIVPPHYFRELDQALALHDHDCHGGPDRAHPSFSPIQKAISFAMTSFLTSGGIRGQSQHALENFTPRGFNMGFARRVYETLGGFRGRFGEDIDLSTRIRKAHFSTRLIPQAFVFHKRRLSWNAFFWQLFVFGITRVELAHLHPYSLKLVHLLPAAFTLALPTALLTALFYSPSVLTPLLLYALVLTLDALRQSRSLHVARLAVLAAFIQLTAYGTGFLYASFRTFILHRPIDLSIEFAKRYEKRK